jgi:hypothetical protein
LLNQAHQLADHHTQYEFDTEMESAAIATDKKHEASGVKPTLSPARKQLQPPTSTSLTDLNADNKDDLDSLPPLPPTPDSEVTNKAENTDSKG